MAITAILVIVVMRLGPETRGKTFATHD